MVTEANAQKQNKSNILLIIKKDIFYQFFAWENDAFLCFLVKERLNILIINQKFYL
jgi:hypothetical protein